MENKKVTKAITRIFKGDYTDKAWRYVFMLFWVALVSIFYFHNYPLPRAIEIIADLILLFILLIISWAIGRAILGWLKVKIDFWEELIFSIGLGLGFLSLLTFFQGLIHLYYSSAGFIIIGLLAIVFRKQLKEIFYLLKDKIGFIPKDTLSWGELLPVYFIFAFIGLSFFYSLAPTTYYDVLVYHLACPQVYLSKHRFIPIAENFYSYFPENIEMLYTLSLQLGSDLLCHFVHSSFGWLTAGAIFVFGRKWFDRKVAIWSALIFISAPMIILLSTGAMIDLGVAFFVFSSLISFIYWWENQEFNWLVVSGIFLGLALGSKYTACLPAIIFYSAYLIKKISLEKKVNVRLAKEAFLYGLTIFLIFSPWLIKNFIFTGNPVFPFLYKFLGGPIETRNLGLVAGHNGVWQLLNNFIFPSFLSNSSMFNFDIFGEFGWGNFLIFLPGIVFLKKIPKKLFLLLSFIGIIILYWLVTNLLLRYFAYLWPVLSIISGWSLISLARRYSFIRPINFLVFFLILFSNLYIVFEVQDTINPYKVILGLETKEKYLTRTIPYYAAINFINKNSPEKSLILFQEEGRGYYCERNYIPANFFALDLLLPIANNAAAPEEIYGYLKNMGVTHFLYQYNQKEWDPWENLNKPFWTKKGRKNFGDFEKKYLQLIFKKENLSEVYELKNNF